MPLVHTRHSALVIPHFGDPARARTWDPLIKSQMLCQLSYGINYRQRTPADLPKPPNEFTARFVPLQPGRRPCMPPPVEDLATSRGEGAGPPGEAAPDGTAGWIERWGALPEGSGSFPKARGLMAILGEVFLSSGSAERRMRGGGPAATGRAAEQRTNPRSLNRKASTAPVLRCRGRDALAAGESKY